jgi:hypothetical protein
MTAVWIWVFLLNETQGNDYRLFSINKISLVPNLPKAVLRIGSEPWAPRDACLGSDRL